MSREDVALIERIYACWNDGDIDGLLELIDPDIEWRPGTDSPFAGMHTGIQGYEEYVRAMRRKRSHSWRHTQ